MVAEILVQQKAVSASATTTLVLNTQNRKVRKVTIHCKRNGITLDDSPVHEIQTSNGKLSIATSLVDDFVAGDEPRIDQFEIKVTDTSTASDQEVTLRVQVI